MFVSIEWVQLEKTPPENKRGITIYKQDKAKMMNKPVKNP